VLAWLQPIARVVPNESARAGHGRSRRPVGGAGGCERSRRLSADRPRIVLRALRAEFRAALAPRVGGGSPSHDRPRALQISRGVFTRAARCGILSRSIGPLARRERQSSSAVEHCFRKAGVVGSNPISGSIHARGGPSHRRLAPVRSHATFERRQAAGRPRARDFSCRSRAARIRTRSVPVRSRDPRPRRASRSAPRSRHCPRECASRRGSG
jgi:hypothetical protein